MSTAEIGIPATEQVQPGKLHRRAHSATVSIAALVLVCAFCSALRFGKLDSFWGDSSRWIFECYRAASGEIPYRDFAWQYPPLAIAVLGMAIRVFGASYITVQLCLDVISTAVVLLTWDTARRLLPRPLPILIAFTLACAGATNTGNFALFSLQVYTPAIPLGMVGMLLVLRESFAYLRSGVFDTRARFWMVTGATIGLLTKPEFILGVAGALAATAVVDRMMWFANRPFRDWLVHYGLLISFCCAPALLCYFVVQVVTGPANLIAGIAGYGIATLSCPWWPTGLGLFGGAVALGHAGIVVAALSATRAANLGLSKRHQFLLFLGAAAGLIATIFYLPYCAREIPVLQGHLTAAKILGFFLSTGTVLLPVMWTSIVLWMVLAVGVVRNFWTRSQWQYHTAVLFVALTSALVMSLRSLFGGTMSQLTAVTVAAYPIWFIVGPYLLMLVIQYKPVLGAPTWVPAGGTVPLTLLVLLGGYDLLRAGTGFVAERKSHYVRLDTQAGPIKIQDGMGPQIYSYVLSHTAENEPVLDVALGGGINFAAHRRSPIFSTQFTALAPAQRYLATDLERIENATPRYVIANQGSDFQATYGLCLHTGCTFPSIVWRSSRLACDTAQTFPVLDYIRTHYQPTAKFGDKVIYARQ